MKLFKLQDEKPCRTGPRSFGGNWWCLKPFFFLFMFQMDWATLKNNPLRSVFLSQFFFRSIEISSQVKSSSILTKHFSPKSFLFTLMKWTLNWVQWSNYWATSYKTSGSGFECRTSYESSLKRIASSWLKWWEKSKGFFVTSVLIKLSLP